MEKAYDLGELGSLLKANGLELAEDAAKIVVSAVLQWVAESAKLSATPYDDMLVVIVPKVKDLILAQVDKIDGKPAEPAA